MLIREIIAVGARERCPKLKSIVESVGKVYDQTTSDLNTSNLRKKVNVIGCLRSISRLGEEIKGIIKDYNFLNKEIIKLKSKSANSTTLVSEKEITLQDIVNNLRSKWLAYETRRLLNFKNFMIYWGNCEMFVKSKFITNANPILQEIANFQPQLEVYVIASLTKELF